MVERFEGADARCRAVLQACARIEAGKRSVKSIELAREADSGFVSRRYDSSARHVAMPPARWRERGEGQGIRYDVMLTTLGWVGLAATQRGVCLVEFGESEAELRRMFDERFARARRLAEDEALRRWMREVLEFIERPDHALDLPVDVAATTFQRRVWNALRQIPLGTRLAYGELAARLGQPSASRAVARACASNPVAVIVPCHRVVAADGSLAGYRWGLERKRILLEREAGNA